MIDNYSEPIPTDKQIDFATAISETLGVDLPDEFTKESYGDFISENVDEFYKVSNEIRYGSGNTFQLEHSYVLGMGFNGDTRLSRNPLS